MSQQPVWKCIGHVGDVDPIAHGGGFVYIDETGVYGPELQFFEPGSDEQWHKTEGATRLQTYRVMLESSPSEWWYSKLGDVAECCGGVLADYVTDAASTDPLILAQLYSDLISYHGVHEFDIHPVEMTEDEAYARYAAEMEVSRK